MKALSINRVEPTRTAMMTAVVVEVLIVSIGSNEHASTSRA